MLQPQSQPPSQLNQTDWSFTEYLINKNNLLGVVEDLILAFRECPETFSRKKLVDFSFVGRNICCQKWKERHKQKTVIKINYFYFWASFIDNHCHNI